MWRIVLLLVFLALPSWASAKPLVATAVTPALAVDLNKGQLLWTWTQGDPTKNGIADGFNVTCTSQTVQNPTPVVKQLVGTAIRNVLVSDIPLQSDTWLCTVDAYNAIGRSAESNSVTFQGGYVPSTPTGFTLGTVP